jgi:hypothetical protein
VFAVYHPSDYRKQQQKQYDDPDKNARFLVGRHFVVMLVDAFRQLIKAHVLLMNR